MRAFELNRLPNQAKPFRDSGYAVEGLQSLVICKFSSIMGMIGARPPTRKQRYIVKEHMET